MTGTPEAARRWPRIGLTPDIDDRAAPETAYVLRRNYADAVADAGGLPLILPYGEDADACLDAIDGLVVTGGMFDINPALYGQSARQPLVLKPARTRFERALVLGALARDLPLLGICNGMQLLAVCLGGGLVQDIPGEVSGALEHRPDRPASEAHHPVLLIGPCHFSPEPPDARPAVNSVHHQSVQPHQAYRATAQAPDGVVEAIEVPGRRFAAGVQWHPEYGASAMDAALWRAFIAAATEFAASKEP